MGTLKDVMMFATGTEAVPMTGFGETPELKFIPGTLPKASTRAFTMSLPLDCPSYGMFKERMDYTLLNAYGFGQP